MSKKSIFILITASLLLLGGTYIWGSSQLSPFLKTSKDTVWLDYYGQELRHPSSEQLHYTDYESIPSSLLEIIIFLEDKRFWTHPGIDPLALTSTLWTRKQGGASTIDQQLVKLLDRRFSNRNWKVKIRENILAVILQTKLSKQEILTQYVNQTHFPGSVYGYRQACLSFFSSDCSNLSLGHLVALYARAKYPHRRDLDNYVFALLQHLGHTKYSAEDIDMILSSMQKPTTQDSDRTYWEILPRSMQKYSFESAVISKDKQSQGLVVQTPFDPKIQLFVGQSIKKFMPYLAKYEAQDACVVVMDGGNIIAADIARSQFSPDATINTCLIPRQIGSVAKPLLYALALHDLGRSPETILQDNTTIYSGGQGFYIPRNSTLKTHGEVTLADALGSSLNIPAVETLSQVTVPSYWSFLHRLATLLGTSTTRHESPDEYGLSLALGTKAITPLDLTQMRSVFAQCNINNSSFHNKDGGALSSFCNQYGKSLHTIARVLMVNSYRRYTFPTNNWLDMPGVYVKTGTSRKFVDGRVCGGDGRYTVCVRVGNASGTPMKDSGYTTAGILWHAIMEKMIMSSRT